MKTAMPSTRSLPLLAALALSVSAFACQAQPAPPPGAAPGNGQPPGALPEAIKACEGKKAGDTASFAGRDGHSLSGVCQPVNGVLAVRPPQMEAGRPTEPLV